MRPFSVLDIDIVIKDAFLNSLLKAKFFSDDFGLSHLRGLL